MRRTDVSDIVVDQKKKKKKGWIGRGKTLGWA